MRSAHSARSLRQRVRELELEPPPLDWFRLDPELPLD
jgi:hypothetical protein